MKDMYFKSQLFSNNLLLGIYLNLFVLFVDKINFSRLIP